MPQNSDSVQPRLGQLLPEKSGLGRVFLVGAGPGDPGLITLRGRDCLRQADFVLYDGLVNPKLLEHASQATCICVGKHGVEPIWSQEDIHGKMVELAKAGHRVVRLKGGDPAVFARTAEELEVLAAAKIPFEVVPGITAALAAASFVGIPITHREHASAVAFITGQQRQGGVPQPIDWQALAGFPGTIVFYMGVTTAALWSAELIKAGMDGGTSAAIVRRCTWSDQLVIRCRLDEVATQLTPSTKLRPPVIVIIGPVADIGREFDWFSIRPLHGVGVLVTRPIDQAAELSDQLSALGADVYVQPVIEIRRPTDTSKLDAAISKLSTFSAVAFSSASGISNFFSRCRELGYDARALAGLKIAVVGQHTAQALEQFGLQADIVPEKYSAADLLDCLATRLDAESWLVVSTNRSRETLVQGLRDRGAHVTSVIGYETHPVETLSPHILATLQAGGIQWVTVTSTSIAESVAELLKGYRATLKPLSLSEAASQRLRELGWPAAAQATEHTAQALVEALLRSQVNN